MRMPLARSRSIALVCTVLVAASCGGTGVLHTESMDPKPHTLGQFFVEWGVELSETCVAEHCDPTPIAVYIDGEPYEGDPRAIELTDEKVIVIAIGTPPEEIPSTYDFSNA